jgi:hypothetical protein
MPTTNTSWGKYLTTLRPEPFKISPIPWVHSWTSTWPHPMLDSLEGSKVDSCVSYGVDPMSLWKLSQAVRLDFRASKNFSSDWAQKALNSFPAGVLYLAHMVKIRIQTCLTWFWVAHWWWRADSLLRIPYMR